MGPTGRSNFLDGVWSHHENHHSQELMSRLSFFGWHCLEYSIWKLRLIECSFTMTVEHDIEKASPINKRPSHCDNASTGGEDTTPQAAQNEEFQPPDGGLLAWSQVLAGIFLNMMAWGYPSTFGVYQLHYRDTLKLPEAQISWIGSLQVFLAFAMCTFSGRLADAGYVKSTIMAGSFLVVFGTFMTSLCKEYWQIFLAQGLCTGLGLGIIFMPPLSVINSYFRTKRASALAISATGTGLGSVIFPATIQYLIPRVGFSWAVRCAGFIALFVSILALLLIRPQLKPRKSGPLVEWAAFKEGPYLLYTLGAFLFFWALYFGFFYVSAPLPPFPFPSLNAHHPFPDKRLRPQHNPLLHDRLGPAPPHHKRHVGPFPPARRLSRRPLRGTHQPVRPPHPRARLPHLRLDRRPLAHGHVCLFGILWPRQWRRAGAVRGRASELDEGSEEDGDEVRDGVHHCRVCLTRGAADGRGDY